MKAKRLGLWIAGAAVAAGLTYGLTHTAVARHRGDGHHAGPTRTEQTDPRSGRPGFTPIAPANRPGFTPIAPANQPGFTPIAPANPPGFTPIAPAGPPTTGHR